MEGKGGERRGWRKASGGRNGWGWGVVILTRQMRRGAPPAWRAIYRGPPHASPPPPSHAVGLARDKTMAVLACQEGQLQQRRRHSALARGGCQLLFYSTEVRRVRPRSEDATRRCLLVPRRHLLRRVDPTTTRLHSLPPMHPIKTHRACPPEGDIGSVSWAAKGNIHTVRARGDEAGWGGDGKGGDERDLTVIAEALPM